ncbi:MAG: DUF4369 domain-containing protein [Flavobacteriaceae bacterium]|nr:DUF4369 domain-containing protein [Flavobacteriaceae bacterium]
MKKIIVVLVISIVVYACSDKKENTMFVQGEVKNLKKGTLYLQKMKDTLAVTVDSITLDGINTFILSDEVESPELYFLSLDKSPSKQISFFGEKGTITINTKLDKFRFGATINGLTNQQLLDEYNEMKSKFSGKRLDLIKADFEAKASGDSIKIDSIENLINGLIKRRYYYTTNFAVNHPDNEVAPYLALTELFDANVKLLDTINSTLTPKVKASKYGKKLEAFIADIKSKE